MKKTALFSFGAGALLLFAIPFSGLAQERHDDASHTEGAYDYDYQRSTGFKRGLPDFYALADRLDDIRYYYTGKAIRLQLAGALATQETAIGIRTDQQDAWRAYTDALLALIPDRDAVLSVIGGPDEDAKGPGAFGRAEALSDALAKNAEKAAALKKAITELRAKLTPEQLEAARLPRLIRG